jgi:hypothetical protein
MEKDRKFRPDPRLKLMAQMRQVMRYHHYVYRHVLDQQIQGQIEWVRAKRRSRPFFIWAAQKKRLREQFLEGAF